jgi:hypothetical protein
MIGGTKMRSPLALLVLLLPSLVWGQQPLQLGKTQSRDQNLSNLSRGAAMKDSDAAMAVMQSMEGTMNMGPHMRMTVHRPEQPGDATRAQQVAEEARKVGENYVDYHAALAAGFVIFHPEIPQKILHFVNYEYAAEAAKSFNPDHPTALLYEKHDETYKLIGVMYTAPRRFCDDQLDQRIPLSIAQWHEHVNDCVPPLDQRSDLRSPYPRFGLRGSFATREACDAAGGVFHPIVFNWMVHLYPFEKDRRSIWSVEPRPGEADSGRAGVAQSF